MRLVTLCLSVGLASLAVPSIGRAADWNNGAGGIKDYHAAGVAVPAPIPYAETFKWYVRADIGLGIANEPSVKETGLAYGMYRDPDQGAPFGSSSSWFSSDFDFFASGGVGAGAYITPHLRADVTVDARTKSSVISNASYSYAVDDTVAGTVGTLRADGSVVDHTDVRATVMLANAYWDIGGREGTFMPYVGIGVGAAVRTMERDYTANERLFDTTTSTYTGGTGMRYTGSSKAHQLAPAVALTAGFGYALSPGMVVDLNYRYTYIAAADFGTSVQFTPADPTGVSTTVSRMTVGEFHEHALRAGLRWNIW